MKKLFSKENFLFSSFETKARRQSLVVFGLLAVLFLISAFTFLNMFYAFVDMIGSIVSGSPDVAIKDLLRSVPLFLCFFMTLWTLLLVHAYFRNASEERRNKSLVKDSISIIAFAGVNIIYILVGRIVGEYLSLVEGSPSYLYPLDALLYSVFFLCLGVCLLLYAKKWNDKFVYVVPSRGPIVTKARFGYCLGISLWMLFSLFTFSGFWMGWFVIDFNSGYLAFSLALMFVYLVNWVFFLVWELYYNELNEEKRKELLFPLALIGLCVAVVAAAIYFVALGLNLDGPSNVGFGLLPVAFAANVNIATLLVVAIPIIVSIVALIKGLKARKK